MSLKTDIPNKISEVFKELEKEIDLTQKEATTVLRVHRNNFRLHMNAGTMNSKEFKESEEKYNTVDNKLKALNQIKNILESNNSELGIIDDFEALDKELKKHIDIAKESELHIIEETFRYFRDKLPKKKPLEELIKLKIKPTDNSNLIKETFLKACQSLDASIFEPLIDEDQYFEELDKYRFLQSMKEQFDYLKGNGYKRVVMTIGTCKICFEGDRVYEFYIEAKKGKPLFAYNIQEKDGIIKDIFRCNFSDGYERAARNNRNPDIEFLF